MISMRLLIRHPVTRKMHLNVVICLDIINIHPCQTLHDVSCYLAVTTFRYAAAVLELIPWLGTAGTEF